MSIARSDRVSKGTRIVSLKNSKAPEPSWPQILAQMNLENPVVRKGTLKAIGVMTYHNFYELSLMVIGYFLIKVGHRRLRACLELPRPRMCVTILSGSTPYLAM